MLAYSTRGDYDDSFFFFVCNCACLLLFLNAHLLAGLLAGWSAFILFSLYPTYLNQNVE
jgi:hypothetical protein